LKKETLNAGLEAEDLGVQSFSHLFASSGERLVIIENDDNLLECGLAGLTAGKFDDFVWRTAMRVLDGDLDVSAV
jgi:hypothetical protein